MFWRKVGSHVLDECFALLLLDLANKHLEEVYPRACLSEAVGCLWLPVVSICGHHQGARPLDMQRA